MIKYCVICFKILDLRTIRICYNAFFPNIYKHINCNKPYNKGGSIVAS